MKGFLFKTGILGLTLIVTYLFFVDRLSYKQVDDYYYKFTQEAGGLILGISRAHDGIVPDILEGQLSSKNLEGPIVNFAFTKNQSPYGEVYLEAIKKKLRKETHGGGVFVLSVNPGVFMEKPHLKDEDVYKMDKKMLIGKVNNFNSMPNYDYIINCYSKSLYNVFTTIEYDNRVVHSNGWMEVNYGNKDRVVFDKDIKKKKDHIMVGYHMFKNTQEVSEYRFRYFIETIKYLKTRGVVVLARIPADPDIIDFETKSWGDFDFKMDSVAKEYQVPYLNYSRETGFKTYDGAHLFADSAKRFTERLGEDILDYMNN
ncbi:hypothetical protein MQE36_08915 [Zhouia spongiae]|uniref:SGNH/GDSL hydrolase family protein n=1 Tax=Zhouia spongiae TaxID=2202721 RepID=A0ABY3YHU9_9FLAO|nr:hypothetical protein [Zhouia spongiae]UNY97217.1 hypothetical protein MQE36_08915 [Zhouia spongiae]